MLTCMTTSHDQSNEVHEYGYSEALKVITVSESTFRRRLKKDGARLGATKLARGWRIPVTTLEALGVLDKRKTGDQSDDMSVTGRDSSGDLSELHDQVVQLQVDNARLRAEVNGLRQVLAEREARLADKDKAFALIESARPRHWWQRFRTRHDDGADEGTR